VDDATSIHSPQDSSERQEDHPGLLLRGVSGPYLQVWQWDVPFNNPSDGPRLIPSPPSLASSGRPRSQQAERLTYIPLSTAPTREATSASPPPPSTDSRSSQYGAEVPGLIPQRPELLALLHSLPHSVTTISSCTAPVALPWETGEGSIQRGVRSTGLIAAATVGGHLEIVNLAQGSLMPLQPHISISLGQSPPLPIPRLSTSVRDGKSKQ